MRRLLGLTLAALVALVALPGLASGAAREAAEERAPSARLEAVGTGRVVLAGRLVAYGQMGGRSRLVVQDMAGDAVVIVAGEELEPNDNGWMRLPRASGRLYVSGSRVTVRLTSTADVNLAIAGNGAAILDGDGRYWLNGGEPEGWDGERLRVEAPG